MHPFQTVVIVFMVACDFGKFEDLVDLRVRQIIYKSILSLASL